MFWGQVTQPELGDKISVTVIATGFETRDTEVEAKEEDTVVEQPKVLPENVVSSSELDRLLHVKAVASADRSVNHFVSKKDIDEENVKKAEKGSLAAGLFQEDELSQGTFVSRKTFATPPAGFDLNSSDLSTPAIWGKNSEYGRTINLSDD